MQEIKDNQSQVDSEHNGDVKSEGSDHEQVQAIDSELENYLRQQEEEEDLPDYRPSQK